MAEGTESWLKRNWMWGVPLGCLGCLGVPLALGAFIFVGVNTTLRQSGAYEMAVERAQASAELREELGAAIEPGWFLSGSIDLSGGSGGNASLEIPLEGADGEGTLYVEATKYVGKWELDVAEVQVEGRSERIDLLDEE